MTLLHWALTAAADIILITAAGIITLAVLASIVTACDRRRIARDNAYRESMERLITDEDIDWLESVGVDTEGGNQ